MARVPVLDRTPVVRVFGIGFIALMLVLVWLTYAVFTKRFVGEVPVTVTSHEVGLELDKNADVKLRGVIVGRVTAITLDGEEAVIHLGLDPSMAATIPARVEAYIVPKTLFGEKYVDLRPIGAAGGAAIQAGARIPQAALPAEVESLLNDAYPLLKAIKPEQLSATLTALSEALDGQGTRIGRSLTKLNNYLVKLAPLSDNIVSDIKALGQVSTEYARAMPEIGDLLDNAVVTGNTVVAQRVQLQQLLTGVSGLSQTTDSFLRTSGQNLITLADESQSTLDLLAQYSPTLPCIFGGIEGLMPRLNQAFRDQRAHITVEFAPRSPTGYARGEKASAPPLNAPGLTPSCQSLPDPPYDAEDPAPGVPPQLLATFGIGDHGKTATPTATPVEATPGSAAEKSGIDDLLGDATGIAPRKVPDVAAMLATPALRGAEVSVR